MRKLIRHQSPLSAASAIFYFVGGVLSTLLITVFRIEANPLNLSSALVAVAAFSASAVFLVLGRRARVRASLRLMGVSAALVLLVALLSPYEFRSMNSAQLFYAIQIYLVWFGSMSLARWYGYTWLVLYSVGMALRYHAEIGVFLCTLVLTSVMLIELVGAYKNRLEHNSLTDPLCGVWNKRGFAMIVDRESLVVKRTGEPLALLYIDLDELKALNDKLGHQAGDDLLRDFAFELDRTTRPQDAVARLGGDEFAVVLPNTTAREARLAGERLRGMNSAFTWSFGVAELQPGERSDDFVARADSLMMRDKLDRKRARLADTAE